MKISFLIPLYNDEKNIVRCIESIQNQKYKDIEIIIVNDGSTDNSLNICEQLKEKYSNIKIITTENKGVCSARNCAVNIATGDYMMFVDSDDYIEEETVKELLKVLKNHDYPDLVIFDYKNLYNNEKIRDRFKNDGKITKYTNIEALHSYVMKNENFSMVLWRRLYKKSLIKNIKFTENMLPEDYATATDYYYNANQVIHLRKSLYCYYIKDDGLTIRKDIDSYIDVYKIKKEVYEKQIKIIKDNSILKYVKESYFKSLLAIFADIYNKEKSKKRSKYIEICNQEIKQFYSKQFSVKTKIAFYAYKMNKYIFSVVMRIVKERKVKNR